MLQLYFLQLLTQESLENAGPVLGLNHLLPVLGLGLQGFASETRPKKAPLAHKSCCIYNAFRT